MIRIVYAVKEEGEWYIDDENDFRKEENLLVAGIPRIIEALAGSLARRVRIEYSDSAFPEALPMRLVSTNALGSTYSTVIDGAEMEGWLCPVFYHYFKAAPEGLHVRIVPE